MKLAKTLIFKNILAVCVSSILFAAACSSGESEAGNSYAAPTVVTEFTTTPAPSETTTTSEAQGMPAAQGAETTIATSTSTSAASNTETADIPNTTTSTTTTSVSPTTITATTSIAPASSTTTSAAPATTAPVVADLSPAQLQVQVLNGSGVAGAAGRLSASLRDAGYAVLPAGNAPGRFATSAVYYVADVHRDEAELVAEVVAERSEAAADGDVAVASLPASGQIPAGTANVVVLIGRDDLGESLRTAERSSGLRRTPDFDTPLPLADDVPRDRFVPGLLDVQIFTAANDAGSDEMKGILNALSGWFNVAARYNNSGHGDFRVTEVEECPAEGYHTVPIYEESYFAPYKPERQPPGGRVIEWAPIKRTPDGSPILQRGVTPDGREDLYAEPLDMEDGYHYRRVPNSHLRIIGTRQKPCERIQDYEYLQTEVWPNIERAMEWLGFTPQNVCGAPTGYSFTDLIKPTREFDPETQNYQGNGILSTDRLLELHGGQRINPEANLDFYILEAVQTAHDHLRALELVDETVTMQIILCAALNGPEGELPDFAHNLWYGGFIGPEPRANLLSQGTYHLREISRNGNLAHVVVCHPTLRERHVLLHWREAGYRAEVLAYSTHTGCQGTFEGETSISEDSNGAEDTFRFAFGERVFSAGDLLGFPRASG